jgi:C-terminal processing protease CtpA/Prc
MTRRRDSLDKLARFTTLAIIAIASAALALASANAQQDRPQRDRTSGRDDSGQSTDQAGQYEQRRRTSDDQNADRSNQERAARARGQQDQRAQQDQRGQQDQYDPQYTDRSQRQQTDRSASTERFDRQSADRGQYREGDRRDRGDQARDQGDRQARDQGDRRGSLRQRLGLSFGQSAQGQGGLVLNDVQQGTTAAQAGLRAGDQIVSIDGRSINNQQQFYAYLGGQSGRQIPLVINRGGRQFTIQLSPDQGDGDVAWLGVFLQDSQDREGAQEGAQVTQIYPAGPAARAGLRPGDVITSVNDQQIGSSADLISTIEEEQPGSRAELTITRNNQEMNLPVTLGSRDSFAWVGQRDDQGGGQGGQYTSSQYGGQSSQSGSSGRDDHFANLPPFAMQLEHERRMYEQHQRIETEIAKLQDEVRQLREALQQQRR